MPPSTARVIVIGASTGGVEALHTILSAFPANCPPVFVVQHMRPGFTETFVAGLNRACRAEVILATDRATARPGHIHIAPPGDSHLALSRHGGLVMRLRSTPPIEGHRPSVDALFHSAASLPHPAAAALLTGMGRDGAEGLLAIRRAGGRTIAQDKESSVVYGMPRAAQELQAADRILPLSMIAAALLSAAGLGEASNWT